MSVPLLASIILAILFFDSKGSAQGKVTTGHWERFFETREPNEVTQSP
jgi:hypothetical protein